MATDLSGPGNLRSSTLDTRLINGCVVALLVLGVVWRTARYLLQFPIWGDEAHIALNVLDRNYLELLQPLRFVQAAPLLFLWAERTAYQLLGSSELAMRLLSFLGGLGGLLLFWRLARTVTPWAASAASPMPAAAWDKLTPASTGRISPFAKGRCRYKVTPLGLKPSAPIR